MSQSVKASIIIPAYNAEKYIAQTLDSIVAQTETSWECIVVDDGSTDSTAQVVKTYPDKRVKLIQIENSGGPARPRNVGIDNACGEFIFMFDSDDLMETNKIKTSVAALGKHPDVGFLFTGFSVIDDKGKTLKESFHDDFNYFLSVINGRGNPAVLSQKEFFDCLVHSNMVGTSGVVIRKNILQALSFDERLKNSDDRLMWFRLAKITGAIYIRECLHKYRITPGGISEQGFLRRAPSKIIALKLALPLCDTPQQKRHIINTLASDFNAWSYALRVSGNRKGSFMKALESLKLRISLRSIKAMVAALIGPTSRAVK